ncbi:KamA family radical SAM protein [Inmirania thermothiophila]|uniref:L-lysine 2,3-aminomutase n=1 Tax=Inmirania thermothiophila TaxID=1750597 RepID=A0A3N1YBY9_9GAMM|nr:KamA family radical SAM protein [Inmirania thermothiophila]ROR35192.1 lysine 2,3-aminomutase [Inmirania thermothiophila]
MREQSASLEEEPPDGGVPLSVAPAEAAPAAIADLSLPQTSPRPVRTPRRPSTSPGDAFRRRHFPGASRRDWNDWRWQMRNRLRSLGAVERVLQLTESEREAIRRHRGALPLGITPYYASLLDPLAADQPLRRAVMPSLCEFVVTPGEATDPLGEEHTSPVPGIVHRYPDRVLFLATSLCGVYCRYCTRARMVGDGGEHALRRSDLEAAIAYIEAHREVRDVLISGGDPLTLDDERLGWILARLRAIPHVEIIRIGTKLPAVLPQRITRGLVQTLRRFHPLWMSLHFTHPDELTPEVAAACARLADAGIPLGSQTVLLKGINDDVATLRALFHGLLRLRVRPYYLYQCDPIAGSAHFRTPVARGLELIRGLRGHTSGYALPTFVVDAPGGGGKIPLQPDPVVGRAGDELLLRNYEGRVYRYPDPVTPENRGEGGTCASA